MKNCPRCNYQIKDEAKFCPNCGFDTTAAGAQNTFYGAPPVQPDYGIPHPAFDSEDVKKTNVISALSYIPGLGLIFLFAALLIYPDSAYVRYHANNVMVLLMFAFLAAFVNVIIIVGQIAYAVAMVMYIVISIMGIVRAYKGDENPLPIISKYRILK